MTTQSIHLSRAQVQGIASVLGDGRLALSIEEIDRALGPVGAAHAVESGLTGAGRIYAGLQPLWEAKDTIEPILPFVRAAIRTVRSRGPESRTALDRCVRQLNLVLKGASYAFDATGYLIYRDAPQSTV